VRKLKKDLWVKLAGLAIVLTLISSSLVSGTYAKYTNTVSGGQTVRVAKFAFNLKKGADGSGATLGDQSSSSDEAVWSIFDHVDSGLYGSGTIAEGQNRIIAPGTTGSFGVQLQNLSEVKVGVTFTVLETNAGSVPIYYTIGADTQRYSAVLDGDTYDGTETYQGMDDFATEMGLQAATLAAVKAGDAATTKDLSIGWTWAFESAGTNQSDAGDTALGIAGTATVKLKVTAAVTQID